LGAIAWVIAWYNQFIRCIKLCEVAGLLADTGGDYAYYKKIYNRFFAFSSAWSTFTVMQTAAISSLAYVFAESLNSIVHLPPMLESLSGYNIGEVFYPFKNFNVKFAAIVLILLLTWINSKGLKNRRMAWNRHFIISICRVYSPLLLSVSQVMNQIWEWHSKWRQPITSQVTFSAMFTAMLSAFWAYQGWASVGFIGGEAKNANKNIPRGIAIGVLTIICMYLLVNTAYLSFLPIESLEQVNCIRKSNCSY
jgi:APA family basic amino acid/polyamine antiporter